MSLLVVEFFLKSSDAWVLLSSQSIFIGYRSGGKACTINLSCEYTLREFDACSFYSNVI